MAIDAVDDAAVAEQSAFEFRRLTGPEGKRDARIECDCRVELDCHLRRELEAQRLGAVRVRRNRKARVRGARRTRAQWIERDAHVAAAACIEAAIDAEQQLRRR